MNGICFFVVFTKYEGPCVFLSPTLCQFFALAIFENHISKGLVNDED